MFSLLSTFSLWLGAALAVPLAIHFLGRQRLQKRPFPSLLLIRERFSKAMHRHRLKNILLLIIRTLLILCLLLALANPAMQAHRTTATPPEVTIALIHNGIYGHLASRKAKDALEEQRQRLRLLDSATGGHTQGLAMVSDGPGIWEASERFGDYREALTRLVPALGSKPGTLQIHIPVFAWDDLKAIQDDLVNLLKENPGLQIAFTDHGNAGKFTQAFAGFTAAPTLDAPTVKLTMSLNPATSGNPNQTGGARPGATEKAQIFVQGRLFQELLPELGQVETTLPLEAPRTLGKFAWAGGEFASHEFHFCLPYAGEWAMVHAGNDLASLPSLGRETYFRRIVHVASSKDIPWSGTKKGASTPSGFSGLKLVYLADERNVNLETYARAVEFVKQGGRLVIGVGQESDLPTLNRFLLQPLRLGRLGNLMESSLNTRLFSNRDGLNSLGRLPTDLGTLGTVRKHFAFLPDSGTETLLFQAAPGQNGNVTGVNASNGAEVILASRDFHRGKVLLWTTDIDNLDWTDIGIRPITPLLHQAFQESGSEDRSRNLSVASDSILTLPLSALSTKADKALSSPLILDPEGFAFTKVRQDGRNLYLGPFDRLGIYQVVWGSDTSNFAVNLADRSRFNAGTTTSAVDDWESANLAAKLDFLKPFTSFKERVVVLSQDEPPLVQTAVRALWPALILASILLLFVEGLIASTFSLRRSRT